MSYRRRPDPSIVEPTDAIMRVIRACVCGSDLWPYNAMKRSKTGQSMGHEAVGIVEDIGAEVRTVKRGDLVIMPFAISDGTCEFCHEGLQTACVHVAVFGNNDMNGAQAEALRIPYADGTLFAVRAEEDDALLPSLLTLSNVMGTGHHAAVAAKVARRRDVVLREHHGGRRSRARARIHRRALTGLLEGRIDPGRVFDRTSSSTGWPRGYRAMKDRESIKVMVRP